MPDITATRPVAGAPIETAWGQQLHDQVEGIQAGTGSAAISGSSLSAAAAVTFARAYASPPVVVVSGTSGPHYDAELVAAPTTTGFSVQFRRTDGSSQSGTLGFTWIAIGTPA